MISQMVDGAPFCNELQALRRRCCSAVGGALGAEASLTDSSKTRSSSALPQSPRGLPRRQNTVTAVLPVFSHRLSSFLLFSLRYFFFCGERTQHNQWKSHGSLRTQWKGFQRYVCAMLAAVFAERPWTSLVAAPSAVCSTASFRSAMLHLWALLNKASSQRQISFGCFCRSRVSALSSMDLTPNIFRTSSSRDVHLPPLT